MLRNDRHRPWDTPAEAQVAQRGPPPFSPGGGPAEGGGFWAGQLLGLSLSGCCSEGGSSRSWTGTDWVLFTCIFRKTKRAKGRERLCVCVCTCTWFWTVREEDDEQRRE